MDINDYLLIDGSPIKNAEGPIGMTVDLSADPGTIQNPYYDDLSLKNCGQVAYGIHKVSGLEYSIQRVYEVGSTTTVEKPQYDFTQHVLVRSWAELKKVAELAPIRKAKAISNANIILVTTETCHFNIYHTTSRIFLQKGFTVYHFYKF